VRREGRAVRLHRSEEQVSQALARLSEEEACKFFKQLISGISYLHKIGCAHRDIKPSNILVDWKYNVKLIDFGLGNLYDEDEKLKTACGSPCYAAPEVQPLHRRLSQVRDTTQSRSTSGAVG